MEINNEEKGLTGFALLEGARFDRNKFIKDFKELWGLDIEEKDAEQYTLTFEMDDMVAGFSLVPIAVPDNEAVICAQSNYMWQEAVEVSKSHNAHLIVAVVGKQESLMEKAKLFVKLLATCTLQENTLGIYTNGTVYKPDMYLNFATVMQKDILPVLDLVWIGMYRDKVGFSAYTDGLSAFGFDEIEVINADTEPRNLQTFVASIVGYVLEQNITLKDGDNIGFTPTDVHKIKRSSGIAITGSSLKVDFNKLVLEKKTIH